MILPPMNVILVVTVESEPDRDRVARRHRFAGLILERLA